MSFASELNKFCATLGCSNKAIAEQCGVSMSTLSRYRSGKRVPGQGSDAVDSIARGLS